MKTLLVLAALGTLSTTVALTQLPHTPKVPQMPRDIYITGEVNDDLASSIGFQLDVLNAENSDPITMHITSGGGGVYAGLRIYDEMMESKAKVNTVCEGYCMSMAAVLLTGGSYREASAHTVIMFHEVSLGAQGKLSEMDNTLNEGKRLQAALDTIIHEHSGMTFPDIKKMESYDHYMGAEEALELGLVDSVRGHR